MSLELKKRIITSIFLLSLLTLMFLYSFVKGFSQIITFNCFRLLKNFRILKWYFVGTAMITSSKSIDIISFKF